MEQLRKENADLAKKDIDANPWMKKVFLTDEEIEDEVDGILARTDLIPGLDGTLDELMEQKRGLFYICEYRLC